METEISSTMRYYESIYERFLSKLPLEGAGDPSKLTRKEETNKYNNRYVWTTEDIETMRQMRLEGISFKRIADRFNISACAVQRLARIHDMKSPTSKINNVLNG